MGRSCAGHVPRGDDEACGAAAYDEVVVLAGHELFWGGEHGGCEGLSASEGGCVCVRKAAGALGWDGTGQEDAGLCRRRRIGGEAGVEEWNRGPLTACGCGWIAHLTMPPSARGIFGMDGRGSLLSARLWTRPSGQSSIPGCVGHSLGGAGSTWIGRTGRGRTRCPGSAVVCPFETGCVGFVTPRARAAT